MRVRTLVGAILGPRMLSGVFGVGGRAHERALTLADAPECGVCPYSKYDLIGELIVL
jgi:hypothetical protein